MVTPTEALTAAGVSIWLDDLSRARLRSGDLRSLVENRHVVGVTTNPSIFAAALSSGDAYAEQLAELRVAGVDATAAAFRLLTADVAEACDVLSPIHVESRGLNGWVSIEVEPALATDVHGTVAQARALRAMVNRDNVMVKVPATDEGLVAITELVAEGISVNATLIFSVSRYRQVAEAYLAGLERAADAGLSLESIHSVASVFVSRVDAEVDRRLSLLGTHGAEELAGRAGLANARLAYQAFEALITTDRAQRLLEAGANMQRPLWASTGVKDPRMRDTAYVVELVAPHVVNTMPGATLEAMASHGVVRGDTVTGAYVDAHATMDELAGCGISLDEVASLLEREGLEKFVISWEGLLASVQSSLSLEAARS